MWLYKHLRSLIAIWQLDLRWVCSLKLFFLWLADSLGHVFFFHSLINCSREEIILCSKIVRRKERMDVLFLTIFLRIAAAMFLNCYTFPCPWAWRRKIKSTSARLLITLDNQWTSAAERKKSVQDKKLLGFHFMLLQLILN